MFSCLGLPIRFLYSNLKSWYRGDSLTFPQVSSIDSPSLRSPVPATQDPKPKDPKPQKPKPKFRNQGSQTKISDQRSQTKNRTPKTPNLSQTNDTKTKLSNQRSQTKDIKSKISNQSFQTKAPNQRFQTTDPIDQRSQSKDLKSMIPHQSYQVQDSKPTISKQRLQTEDLKPTVPNQSLKMPNHRSLTKDYRIQLISDTSDTKPKITSQGSPELLVRVALGSVWQMLVLGIDQCSGIWRQSKEYVGLLDIAGPTIYAKTNTQYLSFVFFIHWIIYDHPVSYSITGQWIDWSCMWMFIGRFLIIDKWMIQLLMVRGSRM